MPEHHRQSKCIEAIIKTGISIVIDMNDYRMNLNEKIEALWEIYEPVKWLGFTSCHEERFDRKGHFTHSTAVESYSPSNEFLDLAYSIAYSRM